MIFRPFYYFDTGCAALRRMAASNCPLCLEPIGYERRYYEHALGLAHAPCVEKQYEGDQT